MRTDILASNVLDTTVDKNDCVHNCLTVFSVLHLIKKDSECEFSTSDDYKDLVVNLYNAITDKKEYTPERFVKCVDCKPQPENLDDIRVLDSFFGLSCGLKDKPDNLAGVLMVIARNTIKVLSIGAKLTKREYQNHVVRLLRAAADWESAADTEKCAAYMLQVLNDFCAELPFSGDDCCIYRNILEEAREGLPYRYTGLRA